MRRSARLLLLLVSGFFFVTGCFFRAFDLVAGWCAAGRSAGALLAGVPTGVRVTTIVVVVTPRSGSAIGVRRDDDRAGGRLHGRHDGRRRRHVRRR